MFEATVEAGLVLRLLEPRHAEALFDLIDRNRDSLGYWFPWVEGTKTVADSRAFIRSQLQSFAQGDGFQLGIWLEGEYIGNIGFGYISQEFRCAEVGCWLAAEYRGRGVMTRTCRYFCGYLFDELELNRIEIRCAETNLKSRAIPERLGFTLEGKLR
jgi:ribosomal-protein-serine acetyltransferase